MTVLYAKPPMVPLQTTEQVAKELGITNADPDIPKASGKTKAKTSKGKAPTALGGGWYLMPDGSKAHGKKAAGL